MDAYMSRMEAMMREMVARIEKLEQEKSLLSEKAEAPQARDEVQKSRSTLKNLLYIPRFEGNGNDDVRTWIQRMDLYFKNKGWSDSEMAGIAASHLEDVAAHWYLSQQNNLSEAEGWSGLRAKLLDRFSPPSDEMLIRDMIDSLTQTDTVDVYTSEFLKLASQSRTLTEIDRIWHYERGLKAAIAQHVRASEAKTLEKAIVVARSYERAAGARGLAVRRRMMETPCDHSRMEVGALQGGGAAEQERCRRLGLCFRCKKRGHIMRRCPNVAGTWMIVGSGQGLEPEEPSQLLLRGDQQT